MRVLLYGLLASLCAILPLFARPGGARAHHTPVVIAVRVRPAQALHGPLVPGMPFTASVQGLRAMGTPYCLGLTSLQDRYGIPVTLGVLHPTVGGLQVAVRVPQRVFPAEPPGPFLLFVGRCTDVAPEGIFGSTIVLILPSGSARHSPAGVAAGRG
jgi:hypothetical protein